MTIVLLIASVILISLYGILMAGLLKGWRNLRRKGIHEANLFPSVSVLIAYRNEELNLPDLLKNLSLQKYPSDKLEFVFVNDHSRDKGYDAISQLSKILPGTFLHLNNPEGKQGKKAALMLGAQACHGDIILLTDADCQLQTRWIDTMTKSFTDQNIQMIQGPVLIHPAISSIGHLQQIEFLSLMMSAAGSIGIQHPILASGANLAVRRQSYLKGTEHLKEQINTGDDMFLLEYFKRINKGTIAFQDNQEAIVRTTSIDSVAKLWNQRKRWTSKSTKYSDPEIIGTAILVFLVNLLIPISLIYGFWNPTCLILIPILWGIKTLTEWPLIVSGCKFYSIKNSLKWFLITQAVYPFYVVLVAFFGVFGSFKWKSRNH